MIPNLHICWAFAFMVLPIYPPKHTKQSAAASRATVNVHQTKLAPVVFIMYHIPSICISPSFHTIAHAPSSKVSKRKSSVPRQAIQRGYKDWVPGVIIQLEFGNMNGHVKRVLSVGSGS